METVQLEIAKQKRDNTAYSEMKFTLDAIKKEFKIINKILVAPEVIVKIDAISDPAWEKVFAEIKLYSTKYFELLRVWENGDCKHLDEANNLLCKTSSLRKRITQRVQTLQ